MNSFTFFASPWWVNLLILAPFIAYYFWREHRLELAGRVLVYAAIFGIAFGFVEAAVVVYLRAAVGLLPGYGGTLSDVTRLSSDMFQQVKNVSELPQSLFVIDFFREIATMVMLVSVTLLAVRGKRERWAIFLWTFAFWDIFYYVWLWVLIRWPASLATPDVLFLVPVSWLSQVWFPILVSVLMIKAVFLSRKTKK